MVASYHYKPFVKYNRDFILNGNWQQDCFVLTFYLFDKPYIFFWG